MPECVFACMHACMYVCLYICINNKDCVRHDFFPTHQAVVRKLGKDEDEHVVASDAELDAKLDLFKSINDTTTKLQRLIEHYQDRICSKN